MNALKTVIVYCCQCIYLKLHIKVSIVVWIAASQETALPLSNDHTVGVYFTNRVNLTSIWIRTWISDCIHARNVVYLHIQAQHLKEICLNCFEIGNWMYTQRKKSSLTNLSLLVSWMYVCHNACLVVVVVVLVVVAVVVVVVVVVVAVAVVVAAATAVTVVVVVMVVVEVVIYWPYMYRGRDTNHAICTITNLCIQSIIGEKRPCNDSYQSLVYSQLP